MEVVMAWVEKCHCRGGLSECSADSDRTYDEELSQSKILIVDDVEINILVLVESLKSYSKISVSMDSEAALKSLSYNLPDIILLDIRMPNMSGFDICEYVKANKNTENIPIIFITSEQDPISLNKAF